VPWAAVKQSPALADHLCPGLLRRGDALVDLVDLDIGEPMRWDALEVLTFHFEHPCDRMGTQ
jgi:hypothetical protein